MKCEKRVPLHVTCFWNWSALTDGLLPTSGRRLLKQSSNWSSYFYWGMGCPFILAWTQPPEGPLHSVNQIPSLHLQKHPMHPSPMHPSLSQRKSWCISNGLKVLYDLASGLIFCIFQSHQPHYNSWKTPGLDVMPFLGLTPQGLPGHCTSHCNPTCIPVNIALLSQKLLAFSILCSVLAYSIYCLWSVSRM